jgi:hypothetical protein
MGCDKMGRCKNQWLQETGVFRLWETPEQFAARVNEIQGIRKALRSGRSKVGDINRLSSLLLIEDDD